MRSSVWLQEFQLDWKDGGNSFLGKMNFCVIMGVEVLEVSLESGENLMLGLEVSFSTID